MLNEILRVSLTMCRMDLYAIVKKFEILIRITFPACHRNRRFLHVNYFDCTIMIA